MKSTNMIKIKKNIFMIVLFSLFISLFLIVNVLAESRNLVPDVDATRKDSVTINFLYHKDNDNCVAIPGATFELYKVANLKTSGGSATYTATEKFAGANIKYNGMTKEDSVLAAKELSKIVVDNNLYGQPGTTNSEGKAAFSGLTHGIYLVRQTDAKGDAKAYKSLEPYLILVPEVVRTNGTNEWKYDVVLVPKPAVIKKTVEPIDVNFRLKKVLDNQSLKDGMFSFHLKETDSNWSVKKNGLSRTVKNDENGDIIFNLSIQKAGTYRYLVREVNDRQRNVIYDKKNVKVSVEIYENREGQLKVKDIKASGDGTFHNKIKTGNLIKTGDTANLIGFIMAIVFSLIAMIVLIKKKRIR